MRPRIYLYRGVWRYLRLPTSYFGILIRLYPAPWSWKQPQLCEEGKWLRPARDKIEKLNFSYDYIASIFKLLFLPVRSDQATPPPASSTCLIVSCIPTVDLSSPKAAYFC